MIFDYKKEEVFTKSLDVVDIGNFTIRATSEDMFDYFLIVRTVMGETSILKFGPVLPDLGTLCNGYEMIFKTCNYKETTICKEVNTYINDPKKKIAEVIETNYQEALKDLPDIQRTLEEM